MDGLKYVSLLSAALEPKLECQHNQQGCFNINKELKDRGKTYGNIKILYFFKHVHLIFFYLFFFIERVEKLRGYRKI